MKYYASEQFAQRRALVAKAATQAALPHFTESGEWTGAPFNIEMREIMWFANAFFEEGSKAAVGMANLLIQKNLPGFRFCHFLPFVCLQSLCHYEDRMEKETVRLIDEYVHIHIEDFMLPELDFVGCNDNFPCMSTGAVLLAGQRYGVSRYIEKARERLRQLCGLLQRRGFSSEFTSPTYTPIQALVLAEIANLAQEEDLRRMAIYGEQRVLSDLLMHLYWPAAQMAGAFSRGYPVDAVGCSHHGRFLYFMLYGDELAVSPIDTLYCDESKLSAYVTHASWDFLRISLMWQAMPDYHCPEELARWAKEKQYPYICAGTSESISSKETPFKFLPKPSVPLADYFENPLRVNFLYTYMTEDYALGSSRYSFHNGVQSHGLRLLYRKKKNVERQTDVGTMFLRYVVNDTDIDWTSGSYFEMGHFVCQQRENSAMILYAPRILHNEKIRSLKLTVNFTVLSGDEPEVWMGGKRVEADGTFMERLGPVYLRDGEVYAMLCPLIPENAGAGMTVTRKEKVLEIAFYNYQGDEKDFDRLELLKTGNGIAFEVRSREQAKSFEAFCQGMKPAAEDKWFNAARQCRYENDGHEMAMEYSPLSGSLRYVSQDGEASPEPRLYSSQFAVPDAFLE